MDVLALIKPMCAPGVDPAVWAPLLADAMPKFDIVDKPQIAAFLANAAHETGGFVELTESLNYSWKALLAQWANHFTVVDAIRFGRVEVKDLVRGIGGAQGVMYKGYFYATEAHAADQQTIANMAYNGRLGNVGANDGWKFRGRGIFQLTGAFNYRGYTSSCSRPQALVNPDLVAQPEDAVLSAGWFWKQHGFNGVLAQRGFTPVRVEINGGTIGLADAINDYSRLTAALA